MELDYDTWDVVERLKELTVSDYSETKIDKDDLDPPLLFVFGKDINRKLVYVKLKIKGDQKRRVLSSAGSLPVCKASSESASVSFRPYDILRRHHSTAMRYSQVKAVTFEKIIEDNGLTATFNVLIVLLSYGPAGHFFSKPKKCPAGLIATIPLALSYVYTCPIIRSRLHFCNFLQFYPSLPPPNPENALFLSSPAFSPYKKPG